MDQQPIEIMPHENGWAITIGGTTSQVFSTRLSAIAAAEKLVEKSGSAVWMNDLDGVIRPYAPKSAKRVSRRERPSPETGPQSKAVVVEHISVPANIHGQDMRETCKEQEH